MIEQRIHHRGRLKQIPIYLGKLFRMFIYMDDWKFLPMSALIAGVVAAVACQNMFLTMEGTTTASLALVCVCIWNGFFNSIQAVCRERDVVKREHRSGMHITSYVAAHMIYQAFMCTMQSAIAVFVCIVARLQLPQGGVITPWYPLDLGITFFLITYAADMMSLVISCVVKTTTAAMTVMPFLLIFQLIFSGSLFQLTGPAQNVTKFTISKWGMRCLCAQADYNSQKMVSVWNQIFRMRDYEFMGIKPVYEFDKFMEDNNLVDEFCKVTAQYSQKPEFAMTFENITGCWKMLLIFIAVFAVLAVLFLERIDHDRR